MAKRKQYNRKFNRKDGRDTSAQSKVAREEKANDPAWYTVSGQLVKDAASLSFNNPSGIQYFLNNSANGSFVNPGIMSIYVAPVPGYSEGLSSPINVAAKNIYGFVRHANSGHSNYDSPDLILMVLGMASAYSYYGWLTRLYGMLRVYSQSNRYLGANMVRACGCDADNLLANMANFRAYINQYALKLSSLNVPATMTLFKRYMWMFSTVFTDENDTKAQFYMYQPAYFYQYDEYNGAGRLVPKPLCLDGAATTVTGLTYGALVAYGDALIGALISSEDINIMSGDILKAYGQENIWKLSMIDENYAIAPMFSEEVLSQIHNTVFAGSYPVNDTSLGRGWASFNVEQDPNIGQGCLICKPLMEKGGNIESMHMLDFWKSEVTPEDVMVATRNMISGMRWSQGFTAVTAFGTEIPLFANVFNLQSNGTLAFQSYYHNDSKVDMDSAYTSCSSTLQYFSKLQAFNEHPQFYLVDYNTSSPYATVDATSSTGELSNFTILDFNDLEKMHLTAILSELAVPMLGNTVKS